MICSGTTRVGNPNMTIQGYQRSLPESAATAAFYPPCVRTDARSCSGKVASVARRSQPERSVTCALLSALGETRLRVSIRAQKSSFSAGEADSIQLYATQHFRDMTIAQRT